MAVFLNLRDLILIFIFRDECFKSGNIYKRFVIYPKWQLYFKSIRNELLLIKIEKIVISFRKIF